MGGYPAAQADFFGDMMETLQNGFILNTPEGTFPLSTDSMVLADFVHLPRSARVLDLGAGCGTLGILLCANDRTCHVTGIELDELSHTAANENIHANNLTLRMQSICDDLRCISQIIPAGSMDVCISNPPYYSGGPANKNTPLARRNDTCTTDDLMAAAAYALRFGGDFFLVQKPERLAELCACASKCGFEPKRLKLVRHRPESPVAFILLQCKKGGKPNLTWEELILSHEDGSPTDEYKRIYHI